MEHGKLWSIDCGRLSASKPVVPLAHPGEECNYVITATALHLDGEISSCGGESFISTNHPSRVTRSREECPLLAVFTSPRFQMHATA